MKININIDGVDFTLTHENMDSTIDVDSLTTIDTSNLFGEAVTISAAMNRVGILKSKVGKILAEAKLNLSIFESDFRTDLRKQASENSGFYTIRVGNDDVKVKATEKALDSAHESNVEWQQLKREHIEAESNYETLDSLYWAIMSKDKKLSNLVSGTTPEDFVNEIVEGKINGFFIKRK